MNTTQKRWAVGCAAVLAALVLAVFSPELSRLHAKDLFLLLSFGMFGTVTVTYEFFQAGLLTSGTTPPTSGQAQNENMLNLTLNWADADTQAVVTHNWNLSAAEQSALLPIVSLMPTQSNTGTTVVALSAQGTNSITLAKLGNAGSGGTWDVWLLRPHTLIR